MPNVNPRIFATVPAGGHGALLGHIANRIVKLRIYTHNRGEFNKVSGKNVLIYWPHGFGDWVQFSLVLPFLNSTNRYWITRFGDDTVSVMGKHPAATPIYLGLNSPHCDHGGLFQLRHFGINYSEIDGQEIQLNVPSSLYDIIAREKIEVVLFSMFPEIQGKLAAPYHTKARAMARELVDELPDAFLRPLHRTICIDEDPLLTEIIEARMKNFCGYGERRLCLIGRGGYTAIGKNWGNQFRDELPDGSQRPGQECYDFIINMLRKCRDWCFLLMEDRHFADSLKDARINTFAYSDIFGGPETAFAPFGRVIKCLLKIASLCVGVPAGPYHLAAQMTELPTIGIWVLHLPSWYDEPRDGLVHLIGAHAALQLGNPGSFLQCGQFKYDAYTLDSKNISGAAVMGAAEKLLGSSVWRSTRSFH